MELWLVGCPLCTDHPRTEGVRGSGSRLQTACTQSENGMVRVHDALNLGRALSNVKVAGRDGKHHSTKRFERFCNSTRPITVAGSVTPT